MATTGRRLAPALFAALSLVALGVGVYLALRESPPPGTPFPGPCRTLTDADLGEPVEATFDYDADGREIERRDPWERVVTVRDSAGRPLRVERWRQVTAFVTRADGSKETRAPGLDSVETFTYDAQGRVATRTWDRDADGSIDARNQRSWADDGRQLAEHSAWETYESDTAFVYDAAGRLVEKRDSGDSENRTVYENDGAGHPLREALYVARSRTPSVVWARQWDAAGRLVQEDEDMLGDGTWDRRQRWERDEDGNVTRKLEGMPPDGPWVETRYDYDCWSWSGGRWTR